MTTTDIEFVLKLIDRYGLPMIALIVVSIICYGFLQGQNKRFDAMFTFLVTKAKARREISLDELRTELKTQTPWMIKISDELERIRGLTHCDRAVLCLFHDGVTAINGIRFLFLSIVAEALSPGLNPSFTTMRRVPLSLFPYLTQRLIDGEYIAEPELAKCGFRHHYLFAGEGAKSEIVFGVYDGNQVPFGFVAAVWEKHKMKDDPDVCVQALREVSATIQGMYVALGGDMVKALTELDKE